MVEEFQEADILFHDHDHDHDNYDVNHLNYHDDGANYAKSRSMMMMMGASELLLAQHKKRSSVPINIPSKVISSDLNNNHSWLINFANDAKSYDHDDINHDYDDISGDYDYDYEVMPPHVVIDKRFANKVSFSMCNGNGRTLKGRDLRRVRNYVLMMTGFLERSSH